MFVLRLQDTEFQYLEQYLINIFYLNNYTQRVQLFIITNIIIKFSKRWSSSQYIKKKLRLLCFNFFLNRVLK
ncbi:hypothetical protein FPC831_130014 [Flavobacterium psychrophilum]|nr:hypothetical protein FPC831_130014 [Flavobacterium psychrophilum]